MLALGNGEIVYAIVWLAVTLCFLVGLLILAWLLVTGQGATWAAKFSSATAIIKSMATAAYNFVATRFGK